MAFYLGERGTIYLRHQLSHKWRSATGIATTARPQLASARVMKLGTVGALVALKRASGRCGLLLDCVCLQKRAATMMRAPPLATHFLPQPRKQPATAQTAGKCAGALPVTPSAYRIATHPQPPLRFRFGYCGCAGIHAFGTFGTFGKLGQ
jgi:hypothetical protein